ncbi:MAG: hypothetical protein R2880_17075 [Deinococcales bacterium]
MIASYTLWDKAAMSLILINPILYDWGQNSLQSLLLSPILAKPSIRLEIKASGNATAAPSYG